MEPEKTLSPLEQKYLKLFANMAPNGSNPRGIAENALALEPKMATLKLTNGSTPLIESLSNPAKPWLTRKLMRIALTESDPALQKQYADIHSSVEKKFEASPEFKTPRPAAEHKHKFWARESDEMDKTAEEEFFAAVVKTPDAITPEIAAYFNTQDKKGRTALGLAAEQMPELSKLLILARVKMPGAGAAPIDEHGNNFLHILAREKNPDFGPEFVEALKKHDLAALMKAENKDMEIPAEQAKNLKGVQFFLKLDKEIYSKIPEGRQKRDGDEAWNGADVVLSSAVQRADSRFQNEKKETFPDHTETLAIMDEIRKTAPGGLVIKNNMNDLVNLMNRDRQDTKTLPQRMRIFKDTLDQQTDAYIAGLKAKKSEEELKTLRSNVNALIETAGLDAAIFGELESVKLLREPMKKLKAAGAEPFFLQQENLALVVQHGNFDVVKELLDSGICRISNVNAFMKTVDDRVGITFDTKVSEKHVNANAVKLMKLLKEKGYDVSDSEDPLPIERAILQRHYNSVLRLIEGGMVYPKGVKQEKVDEVLNLAESWILDDAKPDDEARKILAALQKYRPGTKKEPEKDKKPDMDMTPVSAADELKPPVTPTIPKDTKAQTMPVKPGGWGVAT